MIFKYIFLIFLGLILCLFISLFYRRIFNKIIQRKLKAKLQNKLKKEQKRQQKLFEIDKANKESAKKDKIFMEQRTLKALNDPDFDLFYEEEMGLHKQRLEFKKRSKWKGIIHYISDKGKVFVLSKDGKRIYKPKD